MKATGRATSFITAEDPQQLRAIERLLGHALPLAAGSPQPVSIQPSQTGSRRHGRPFSGRTARSRLHVHENHPMTQGSVLQ
jgi:ATP-dependent RNA helicase RhlE